jgi:hypothetical protein
MTIRFIRFLWYILAIPGMFLSLALQCKKEDEEFIITSDDVLMMVIPASGLESAACADFASSRSFELMPADSQLVNWSEGRSLANDTIQIIRLEVLRDTGSVLKFTMTFRPHTGRPSEIQCMKGFGCDGPWETFPWKSPDGNFLDHTVQKFKVIPRGKKGISFQNFNTDGLLTVRVNPPI